MIINLSSMEKITSQKELRKAFWQYCRDLGGEFEIEANKKRHRFKLDFNIAFNEWKDCLNRDSIISDKLKFNATLYQ